MSLARTLHASLDGHAGPVHVARYSKGAAKYVLTGGQDRTVRLWNPHTGAQINVYKGHGYEVLSISVTPDNAKFASSGGDRSIFLWDVTTAATIRRIPGHMSKVNVVEFNADASVVVGGSYDSSVRVWDLKSQNRQPIQTLDDSRDSIQTLHVGGDHIITGSVDGHVRMYDIRNGRLRSDYLGQPITSILPTKDSQTLLVATLDSKVRLLDLANGQILNTFEGHAHQEYRCRACFGVGEAIVVCGDEQGKVWAWDLVEGKPLKPDPPPKVHDKVITWVEHHPAENELITASADGTVKVWRP